MVVREMPVTTPERAVSGISANLLLTYPPHTHTPETVNSTTQNDETFQNQHKTTN